MKIRLKYNPGLFTARFVRSVNNRESLLIEDFRWDDHISLNPWILAFNYENRIFAKRIYKWL